MTAQTVETAWEQLEDWLEKNAPEMLAGLNPGATEAEISACEKALNVQFPGDVKACYRRHNGQNSDSPWFFDGLEFLSLERILDEWSVWKDLLDGGDFEDCSSEPPPEVKNNWWNQYWIPFTYNGSGDHLSIDLDPTSAGTKGQIIKMWHDWEARTLLTPSFSEWFSNFVAEVLAGKIGFVEE